MDKYSFHAINADAPFSVFSLAFSPSFSSSLMNHQLSECQTITVY